MSEFPLFDSKKSIAIIGSGVMGAKVAWVCAKSNLETRVFDVDRSASKSAKDRAITWSGAEEVDTIERNFIPCGSLEEAIEGVQLVFENVPEKLDLKKEVLEQVSSLLPPTVYIGSNASSITCTPLGQASRRPSQFFNLNFSDPLESTMVELMGSAETADSTIQFAKDWSKAIGMVCIHVRKEQLGYSFNRLWRVIKQETLRQLDQGFTTPEDIDRAWMLSFGTDIGPCGIMDEVGLHTILSIETIYFQNSGDDRDRPPRILEKMVAEGKLGALKGEGFYSYPNPSFREPHFLTNSK